VRNGNGGIGVSLRHLRAALLSALLAGFAQNALAQADTDENRLSVLEAKLATLEAELGLVEDIKSIKRLQHAYAYYLSKGLADEIADLFSEQAPGAVEIGRQGVYVGRESIRDYFAHPSNAVGEGRLNNHIIAQGIVHVAPDGRTAKGRWRLFAQEAVWQESDHWGVGVYENDYVNEDGTWKIQHLRLHVTLYAPYAEGWGGNTLPNPGTIRMPAPDRPSAVEHEAFPAVSVVPFHYENPVTGAAAYERSPAQHAPPPKFRPRVRGGGAEDPPDGARHLPGDR
jgi:hypothetical protein